MIEFHKIANPKPLVSIDQHGEVQIFWDAVEELAKEYKPLCHNETNTAWAYVLMKLKNEH